MLSRLLLLFHLSGGVLASKTSQQHGVFFFVSSSFLLLNDRPFPVLLYRPTDPPTETGAIRYIYKQQAWLPDDEAECIWLVGWFGRVWSGFPEKYLQKI
jgi:hypothetical protein